MVWISCLFVIVTFFANISCFWGVRGVIHCFVCGLDDLNGWGVLGLIIISFGFNLYLFTLVSVLCYLLLFVVC